MAGDVRGGDLRSGSTVCPRRREEPARGGAGFRIEPRHDCQDVPLFGAAVTVAVAAIEGGVPTSVEAREVIAAFHAIIRRKAGTNIAGARKSLVASFANGVAKDEAAVRAAIISPWSNGQTEGQITKLKLVKRQMYGRAKIDRELDELIRVAQKIQAKNHE
jgi:hypothetical protein